MTQLYTQNGYILGEVISALQKDVRRGNEEAAMYWALELCPKFERYFWRRLVIIAQEDIGLANPNLLVMVKAQKDIYFDLREYGDSGVRLVIANAVLAMCRSPKSRLADYFQCAVNQDRLTGAVKREIPDYALDKHTGRGRNMGRGIEHWHQEGCVLNPEGIDPVCQDTGDYQRRALEYWSSDKFVRQEWPKLGKGSKTDDEQLTLF